MLCSFPTFPMKTEKKTAKMLSSPVSFHQASVLASQERLQYVAAFGDKKEYIAIIETKLRNAR